MRKPFIQAQLVIIDTLQLVDKLVMAMKRYSRFGRDTVEMIYIKLRDPICKICLYSWIPPHQNKYFLHIDNLALIGGVI